MFKNHTDIDARVEYYITHATAIRERNIVVFLLITFSLCKVSGVVRINNVIIQSLHTIVQVICHILCDITRS